MVHPTVAQLADVGDRGPEGVDRERQHDRVEVAVADHPPLGRHDQRVVVHRRELDLDRGRGGASTNSRKAPWTCGRDAERQRVLHRARCRRAEQRSLPARKRPDAAAADRAGRGPASPQRRPDRRSRGCPRSPRAKPPATRSAAVGEALRRGRPASAAQPDGHAVRRDQGQAVLRARARAAPCRPRRAPRRRRGSRPRILPCRARSTTWAIAAMCIRSDAPTDPIAGTTGWTPASSMATSAARRRDSRPRRRARSREPDGHRRPDDLGRERVAERAVVAGDDAPPGRRPRRLARHALRRACGRGRCSGRR